MQKDRTRQLTSHILEVTDRIYRALEPQAPHQALSRMLSSDLTVAQLRVLLLLHTGGEMSMGEIAKHLSIAFSTATGIVDKLVAKQMVLRETGSPDRRMVTCRLAPAGTALMGGLWDFGRSLVGRLLEGLTQEQLEQAAGAVDLLYSRINARTETGG
jgi:DNA-binding MarR family transcriptional regulator